MFILAVIILGMLLSVGSVSMWYQVTSLSEIAVASYQKEQRVVYTEGILAYGVHRYRHDTELRKGIKKFGRQELFLQPPVQSIHSQAKIIYELVDGQLMIQAVTQVAGQEEIIMVQWPVQ